MLLGAGPWLPLFGVAIFAHGFCFTIAQAEAVDLSRSEIWGSRPQPKSSTIIAKAEAVDLPLLKCRGHQNQHSTFTRSRLGAAPRFLLLLRLRSCWEACSADGLLLGSLGF